MLWYTRKGFAFQVPVSCRRLGCIYRSLRLQNKLPFSSRALNFKTPKMMIEGAEEWCFGNSFVTLKSGTGLSVKL